MKKRLTGVIISVILALSLIGCGVASPSGNTQGRPPEISPYDEIIGEITVSAFDFFNRDFLLRAAELFEEKHPGTAVNIETFSAMPEVRTAQTPEGGTIMVSQIEDDPQARADYINRISAALMSGEGPDILAMDVLPIDRFARSGFLVDLSGYMQSDPEFNREDFRANILDAARTHDGQFFMPLDYIFSYYTFDSALVPQEQTSQFGSGSAFSAGQLMEIGAPLFDGSAMLFSFPDHVTVRAVAGQGSGMFHRLFADSFADFVDMQARTANFDDGAFTELLYAVRGYTERGYIPRGVDRAMDIDALVRDFDREPTERFIFKPRHSSQLVSEFTRGRGGLMMRGGGSMAGIEDDDMIAGIAANADGSVPFTFMQAYAINANSENQRLAWEFIKFLLSEEMQLSIMFSATPIRVSAIEQRAAMMISGFWGMPGHTPDLDDEEREILRQFLEAEAEMAAQINTFNIRDTIVSDMIAAEVALFFDGSKSAQEVALSLQSRVSLFLSEQGA